MRKEIPSWLSKLLVGVIVFSGISLYFVIKIWSATNLSLGTRGVLISELIIFIVLFVWSFLHYREKYQNVESIDAEERMSGNKLFVKVLATCVCVGAYLYLVVPIVVWDLHKGVLSPGVMVLKVAIFSLILILLLQSFFRD